MASRGDRVVISPIDPKDLSEFEGLPFQVHDDEEFEDMESPDDQRELA